MMYDDGAGDGGDILKLLSGGRLACQMDEDSTALLLAFSMIIIISIVMIMIVAMMITQMMMTTKTMRMTMVIMAKR